MATNLFDAPIPGQSLTTDPDSAGPWEMPPKFNNTNQALDHLFKVVTSQTFIRNYTTVLEEDKKCYIDQLAVHMLSEGFINGFWTVDVMMLLVEPLIIMLVWAAAQLHKNASFSNDTGYEDRTGFEELAGLVADDEIAEGPSETPEEPAEDQAPAQSPLTANVPQSPLTGGM